MAGPAVAELARAPHQPGNNVSVNGSISQKATLAVTGLVLDVRTGRTQLVERRAPLRS